MLFVVVMGEVEYLDCDGAVRQRITAADRIDDYLRHCREAKMESLDLMET